MTDRKPPRSSGDERETLVALLQFQRESMLRKVDGLDDERARAALVSSGTTLLWLVKHLARAERLWVLVRFAGSDADLDDTVTDDDTLAGVVAAYRDTWREVDAVVSAHSLDDLTRGDDPALLPVNLRWILGHLLEETARHAGHADIIREQLDGQLGR